MPKNCSKDVSRVVDYVDRVASSGTKEQQQKLKELFGLGELEHFDDFAAYVLSGPASYGSNVKAY